MGRVDLVWLADALVIGAMVALVVLVGLAWRGGWWRAGYLGAGPRRPVGVGGMDLLVGFGLLLVGGEVFGLARGWLSDGTDVSAVEGEAGWRVLGDGVLLRQGVIGVVGQCLGFGLVVGYAVWRVGRRRGGLRRWGLWGGVRGESGVGRALWRGVVLGVAGLIVVMPVALLAGEAYELVMGEPAPQIAHPMLDMMRAASAWWAVLPLVVSAVVLAPLFEELLFRGVLQTVLVKRLGWRSEVLGGAGRWVGVGLTAGLFGVIHLGSVEAVSLPGLVVLGVVLGAYYERTGDLLGCVVGHAVFNAANVVLALYVVG
ncbi:MAG: CPBP family intramembrane glutamic endopeptidase [Planctomycetota bacterium]